jgi:hypothetical protein
MPPYLLSLTQTDLDGQPVRWRKTSKWTTCLAKYPALVDALVDESAQNGGRLRRQFVHAYASADPVELFLAAMAWGLGTKGARWRGHQTILASPPRDEISAIVDVVRSKGAEAGWTALMKTHKIPGLGYAFGTKLLYFAGYTAGLPGLKPLILDANVLAALHDASTGILASDGVWRADYLAYLELAGEWSREPAWPAGTPELVEYGLFARGQELVALVNRRRNASA